MGGSNFASVAFGRETCDSGDLARHRHEHGYLTLVLSSSYVEAGDAGRFHVREGDVLVHRPFEAHRDVFLGNVPKVLNLPLPSVAPRAGLLRTADPDHIVKVAERDLRGAAFLLCATAEITTPAQDWPEMLAAECRKPNPIRIGDWARLNGLSPATVSRGFRQVFGITAARYRAEARARIALESIRGGSQPLVHVAYDLGFADQAHMSRSIRELTGGPAKRWRQGQINSRLAD